MGWFEERGGLAGTVAVITGGAGGLGEAISSDLAANGVRLAVIDIDAAAAGRLRGSLAGAGHDGGTFASSDWFNWPDWGWANHAPPRFLPAISLARLIVAI
jgi:NAD(P)-dependent dehydrogenase (short-subunit alcohol dehydrogenase family)